VLYYHHYLLFRRVCYDFVFHCQRMKLLSKALPKSMYIVFCILFHSYVDPLFEVCLQAMRCEYLISYI